jgi:hypothetical protein
MLSNVRVFITYAWNSIQITAQQNTGRAHIAPATVARLIQDHTAEATTEEHRSPCKASFDPMPPEGFIVLWMYQSSKTTVSNKPLKKMYQTLLTNTKIKTIINISDETKVLFDTV